MISARRKLRRRSRFSETRFVENSGTGPPSITSFRIGEDRPARTVSSRTKAVAAGQRHPFNVITQNAA